MAKNDDGEFELVVGNKQLLSIVFIVFLLCGIVFSMGYFVGRNSGPEAAQNGGKQPAASMAQANRGDAEAVEAAGTATPASDSGEAAVPPGIQPQARPQQASAVAPAPASQAPDAGSESPSTEPAPGQTFLQVAAVNRPEAEVVADVLKNKGFPALTAPGPNSLLRVLVGPLKDSSEVSTMRSDLESAGFKPIVRKY